MSIVEYFDWYILYIPWAVYAWGLMAFFAVLGISTIWKGFSSGLRHGVEFLLIEYVALLLYFTIFKWRNTGEYEYSLVPFWSYKSAIQGCRLLLQEILMNIAVFVPIGFLVGTILRTRQWWKALLVGLSISLTIELLQLFLKRGFCEIDDVINNTLGCMIGYGLFSFWVKLWAIVALTNNRVKSVR